MTLQACYAAMDGDYKDVLGRLRSERLVQRFVLKFLADGSYDLLCRSMEQNNVEEAFRAAHTMKGVCQNLSFTRLADSSSQMTELLRGGDLQAAAALLPTVRDDYQRTVGAIRMFEASLSE